MLRHTMFLELIEGATLGDSFQRLDHPLKIPVWETRGAWFEIDTATVSPGHDDVEVVVRGCPENEPVVRYVTLRIEVVPVRMPVKCLLLAVYRQWPAAGSTGAGNGGGDRSRRLLQQLRRPAQ